MYLKLPVRARPRISHLFDRRFYTETNPDIAAAGVDPFIHFVVNGCPEARSPHPLIDIPYIVKANPFLLRQPFGTAELYDVLHDDHQSPSPYFSLEYCKGQISQSSPDVPGLLEHFLKVGLRSGSQPNAFLDLHWYYRQLDGAQDVWSGLRHFVLVGDSQGRSSSPAFSGRRYRELYPDVAAAGTPPLLHYLTVGIAEGRAPVPAVASLDNGRRNISASIVAADRGEEGATATQTPAIESGKQEQLAMTLFRLRAEDLLLLAARHPVDFTFTGTPELSVVMILGADVALAVQTLSSLRQSFPGRVELLLVDTTPIRQGRFIDRYMRGAHVLRLDSDVDLVNAANAAIACATASAVLLLGSEVELAPAAISLALSRLFSDPAIGAVGGKLIRANGRLLAAGGIIGADGSTRGYMQDASPHAPEANFVRDVDFCSGAFLLVRADLLKYPDGGREDFTLCVRIARAGFRIVYDPSVVVYVYGTARDVPARDADHGATVFARSRSEARRVLFIEDQMPLRMLGSGFVRSNDLLRTMAGLGLLVTVFPLLANRLDAAAIHADMPDTVEAMHDRSLNDLAAFLQDRDGYYDTIWIARTHNLDRAGPVLARHLLGKAKQPRIILDTEAIASLREAGRARVNGKLFDLDAALAAEFQGASLSHHMIAVTEDEASQLRGLGFGSVSVIGHVRDLALGERGFSDRSGLLFLGAIHEVSSPNFDSICWFLDAVLPRVEAELSFETRLTIAGYVADDVVPPPFGDHPRITFRRDVMDTTALYNTHRVFVAPTRFAAGAPYKLYEAASCGLPIVASELLRRQVGWENGRDILSADVSDPDHFANQIIRLYRDQELWHRLRGNAAARLANENSPARYVTALEAVL